MSGDLNALTAVIVNWMTPRLTLRAAAALIADGIPASRIVIVDQGSTDDSLVRIATELPNCLLVPVGMNVGYARGCNLGAAQLPGDLVLLVNSDAFAKPGSVRRLIEAVCRPGVAIAVPRLRNEDGSLQPSVLPLQSLLSAMIRASGLSRLLPNHLQPRLATHWDHSAPREINCARGPVILIRAEAWRDLGGFDEDFHFYGEELDLFWRARKRGWRSRFEPSSEWVHLGGFSASTRWNDAERAERRAAATAKLTRRHLPGARARLVLVVTALGYAVRAVIWAAFSPVRSRALVRAARATLTRDRA